MLIWAPFLQRCVLFLSVLTAVHIPDLPKNYHLCGSILKETTIPHKLTTFPDPELFKQLRAVLSKCGGSEMK